MKKSIPFKNGITLSFFGLATLTSYGIYAISTQQDQTLDNLPNLSLVNLNEVSQEEEKVETSTSTSPVNGSVVTIEQQKENSLDKYDNDYLKGVTSYSLANKYKNYLVLVPRDSDVGKGKAEKMAQMAEKETNKQLYTYWKGYLGADYIRKNPILIADGCRNAVSYSEGTTGFTIPTGKAYWNLLWDICGRDDKNKPQNWW